MRTDRKLHSFSDKQKRTKLSKFLFFYALFSSAIALVYQSPVSHVSYIPTCHWLFSFQGLKSWRRRGRWSVSAKGLAGQIFVENWNSMRKCWNREKMLRVWDFTPHCRCHVFMMDSVSVLVVNCVSRRSARPVLLITLVMLGFVLFFFRDSSSKSAFEDQERWEEIQEPTQRSEADPQEYVMELF